MQQCPIDANAEELAERLAQLERVLARVRSRRLVRMSAAFRKVQHGRSLRDLQDAWALLRGFPRDTGTAEQTSRDHSATV